MCVAVVFCVYVVVLFVCDVICCLVCVCLFVFKAVCVFCWWGGAVWRALVDCWLDLVVVCFVMVLVALLCCVVMFVLFWFVLVFVLFVAACRIVSFRCISLYYVLLWSGWCCVVGV